MTRLIILAATALVLVAGIVVVVRPFPFIRWLAPEFADAFAEANYSKVRKLCQQPEPQPGPLGDPILANDILRTYLVCPFAR
jgi:hypothetical protein